MWYFHTNTKNVHFFRAKKKATELREEWVEHGGTSSGEMSSGSYRTDPFHRRFTVLPIDVGYVGLLAATRTHCNIESFHVIV